MVSEEQKESTLGDESKTLPKPNVLPPFTLESKLLNLSFLPSGLAKLLNSFHYSPETN